MFNQWFCALLSPPHTLTKFLKPLTFSELTTYPIVVIIYITLNIYQYMYHIQYVYHFTAAAVIYYIIPTYHRFSELDDK